MKMSQTEHEVQKKSVSSMSKLLFAALVLLVFGVHLLDQVLAHWIAVGK